MNNRRDTDQLINVYSTWWLRLLDKNGNIKHQVEARNLVTTQGKNFLLDVMFHGTAALGTWYVVLWSGSHTPVITDVYATPGYTELNTVYDDATRPAYSEAAASAGVMTNAANRAAFTFNAAASITGLALVGGSSTKGDTASGTGILFSSTKLGSSFTAANDDVVNVLGTLTAA